MQQSQSKQVRKQVRKPVQPVPGAGGKRWRLIAGGMAAAACAGLVVAALWWRTSAVPAVAAVPAGAGASAGLTVNLTGVAGNQGQVLAALCDRDSFLKRCRYMLMVAAAPSVKLHFNHVVPGKYALMAFHDENANGTFDKAANGMPLEGYGFSRNARGKFGPPSFDDAAIDLQPGTTSIDVELAY
ncbi:MAG: DUF2141 domain-containing protein [Pseudomonadota bacterium]